MQQKEEENASIKAPSKSIDDGDVADQHESMRNVASTSRAMWIAEDEEPALVTSISTENILLNDNLSDTVTNNKDVRLPALSHSEEQVNCEAAGMCKDSTV